jgi:hypothetical protein
MKTKEYCKYVCSRPTDVDFEISTSYYTSLQTSTEQVPESIKLWAQKFANEHDLDMFAWDSLNAGARIDPMTPAEWVVHFSIASPYMYIVEIIGEQETMYLVKNNNR